MIQNLLANPAAIIGLVRAAIAVGIILGLPLTEEQTAAAVGIVSLLLTMFTVKTTVGKAQVVETTRSYDTKKTFVRK